MNQVKYIILPHAHLLIILKDKIRTVEWLELIIQMNMQESVPRRKTLERIAPIHRHKGTMRDERWYRTGIYQALKEDEEVSVFKKEDRV